MKVQDISLPELHEFEEKAESAAKVLMSQYDHLNVFPQKFKDALELALYKGYRQARPRRGKGAIQRVSAYSCFFTLDSLKYEKYTTLAKLALHKYNNTIDKEEGQWAFHQMIYYASCIDRHGCAYSLYFGAHNAKSEVLRPFHAQTYRPHGKTESDIKIVCPLRSIRKRKKEVDQLGSSDDIGKQQDDSIVMKTRKMTYKKQGDSCDIISYRNTEEDKMGSFDEKDKQVEETSTDRN